jgi:hypothetical protein
MRTPETDRLIRMHTICHFANDWHSGQWSRGYRLLCRTQRWLARHRVTRPLDARMSKQQKALYAHLLANYGDKI